VPWPSGCSRRWTPEFPAIDGPQGLNLARWAKKLTAAATISVGSAGRSSEFLAAFGGERSAAAGLGQLIERMDRGEFDLAALATLV